jgi:hypothetical protein
MDKAPGTRPGEKQWKVRRVRVCETLADQLGVPVSDSWILVIGSIQWRYDMKKIVIFIAIVVLVLLAAAACGPSDNAVEIAQAQSVIEAARAAQDAARAAQIASQGLSDVGRGQTLILVLLTSGGGSTDWAGCLYCHPTPDLETQPVSTKEQLVAGLVDRTRTGSAWTESDPYQQLLLQQQMLLTQLLQQSQTETQDDDHLNCLPAGGDRCG